MSKKRRRKKVRVKPPLKLLVYQNGLVVTPLYEAAALGQRRLEGPQRAITIGEPVPIVFCRRVNNVGGVLVSPGATEGRYTNNATTNTLTANVHLVLSEGQLPQIPIKDVFQAWCRVGTWRQTYNRRAGTWTPGNFITTVSGFERWDCPVYCGTSGSYANMTTLSFTNQFGFGLAPKDWDKQVHCFVRNGMQVTRIIDSTLGSSNNVIDLALYLIRQSSRLPEDMLDTASMLIAAQFTNANGLFYNGVFEESTNLEDWLQDISLNFLLRFSDKNGKKAFLPRLPYNNDYTIKTTAITWVFAFTEEHITPDGFEIEYIPLSERKPICAQMLWREQPDDDLGLVRTTEVRFNGEAESGPFEQYDLTQFCTSENHAVKVGTYIIARRKYVSHTVRLRVKPDSYNGTLVVGDIVRVRLRRETDVDAVTFHDYLYEVERINKSITGAVELDLVHFPVDSQNRSIIAQIVGPAVGVNYNLATGRDDFTCDDAGRRTDNTGLTDEGGNLPGLPAATNFESLQSPLTESAPTGPIDNPADPALSTTNAITESRLGDVLTLGDTLNLVPPCPGGKVDWYRRDKATGARSLIKSEPLGDGWQAGSTLSITTSEIDYFLEAEASCPDPSSPTGFGTPIPAKLADGTEPEPQLDCDNNGRVESPCSGGGIPTGGTVTQWIRQVNPPYGVGSYQIQANLLPGNFYFEYGSGGAPTGKLFYKPDSGNAIELATGLVGENYLLRLEYSGVTCPVGQTPQYGGTPCAPAPYANYDPNGTVTYMTIEGTSIYSTDVAAGANPDRYPADLDQPFEYWILGEGLTPRQDLHITNAFVQDNKDGSYNIYGQKENGSVLSLWTGAYSNSTPIPITWSNTATKPAYP
jgi:hypothetical protein